MSLKMFYPEKGRGYGFKAGFLFLSPLLEMLSPPPPIYYTLVRVYTPNFFNELFL